MTLVTSYIEAPGSARPGHRPPAVGVAVAVRIRFMPVPWLGDSSGKVLGTSTTWTGPNGWWQLDIRPHTEFELPDYVYAEIVEHSNDPTHAVTYYAQVPPADPTDPTKPVLLRDILIDPPPVGVVPPFPPQPPWVAIDRLSRLRDVDAESVRAAKPGDALILLASGRWGAGRILPLSLYWEPERSNLLTIQYRVSGFGGGGARVGFGDGSPEVVVTTSAIHTHTYAVPGTYILTAADVNNPAFNANSTVTVKDHAPRVRLYLDGDDDWRVLCWLDEPADDTKFAISWGDGGPVEQHSGQRLERVPPRPRVPHQYTAIGEYDVVATDLSTKRQTTQRIEIGEIGVLITYDDVDHPRIDAHWLATGSTWEMQRDGFPPASGIVPASGRVSHLGPVVAPGDYRFEVREVIGGVVRRRAVRRRVQPTQWDWRMQVELTWRDSTDPQGKQTVRVAAKGARSRCTVEWGDGSAAGVVDPGATATHVYTLPAPPQGWRLRLTETQIADPRTWTRVLGEPRRVGTPVLTARTQGSVDLDVLGIDQDYNDDWYAISWDLGAPAIPVGAIGRWFPATHVYSTPGHKVIQLDGPGMEVPIKREVDVIFYPSPVLSVAEARDGQGMIEDPTRRTARINVDNTQSGGKCTVRMGDGSAPRECNETEVFTYQYPADVNGTVYVIAHSNADPTAKARIPVTIPFGAARTLFYEVTGVRENPGDTETYKAKVAITGKDPSKGMRVQWDVGGDFEPIPPSDEITHVYAEADLHTITVEYVDRAESWPTDVDIPIPLEAVVP